jgi:tetratricopeptide (TPR) repeat protein
VTEAPYERYKDALRRGHVALARGRADQAIAAYAEAAEIAPDRALPLVGIGNAYLRLGRPSEGLAAFDRALGRSPSDEGALAGRAEALAALERRAEAAESLDRLAIAHEAAGSLTAACDAARRALEMAELRERRRTLERLVGLLAAEEHDPTAHEVLARARELLEATAPPEPPARPPTAEAVPETAERPPEPVGIVVVADQQAETEPPGPPPDPVVLAVEGELLLESGELDRSRRLLLAAARGFAADGRLDAAVDACTSGLRAAPGDVELHFELVDLYLRQGWRSVASEKLQLLARLARMADDRATLERIAGYARGPLADDPALGDLRIL